LNQVAPDSGPTLDEASLFSSLSLPAAGDIEEGLGSPPMTVDDIFVGYVNLLLGD